MQRLLRVWMNLISYFDLLWFLVFGLLCRNYDTASNPITKEMHTSGGSTKEARKRLTKSNGTPAMDFGLMNVVLKEYYFCVLFHDCCFEVDIRIRRYTNKRLRWGFSYHVSKMISARIRWLSQSSVGLL